MIPPILSALVHQFEFKYTKIDILSTETEILEENNLKFVRPLLYPSLEGPLKRQDILIIYLTKMITLNLFHVVANIYRKHIKIVNLLSNIDQVAAVKLRVAA